MTELRSFMVVAEINREEALQIAKGTAIKIASNETKLIDVVQSLGEYINDEDAIVRGKAVSYLTGVIEALPNDFLSRQQIYVLTEFFCNRLEDGGAITGLDRLQELGRFTNEMGQMVARAMFEHAAHLKRRSQSQRHQGLLLLDHLIQRHRNALRSMGDESLVGIIELIDGERDPRNLVIVFVVLKIVMTEWDISNHIRDLFDSAYNYFPVTFRPPPNDPYGITAQDLKDLLQKCISANQHFAPFAFPALIDKLDSTSVNVKKDSLMAILACVNSYSPEVISRYSLAIWDALKFEILNSQEQSLSQDSLTVLKAVAKRLSSLEESLAGYINPVTGDCNEQLREPEHKQARPAQEIVQSISAASSESFSLVINTVLNPLLIVYTEADEIVKKRALLETFVILLDSAVEVYGTWKKMGSDPAPENPLTTFRDRLVEIFSQALMGSAKDEISFRKAALQGMLRLSVLRGFLSDHDIGLYIRFLNSILLENSPERREICREAITALAEIAQYKPRLIIDITFPAFIVTLPESDVGVNAADATPSYLPTLDSLAQISTERDVCDTLIRRALGQLGVVLTPSNPSTPAYPHAILLTILYALRHRDHIGKGSLAGYFDRIVVRFCRSAALAATEADFCVVETQEKKTTAAALTDPRILETLGDLCSLIISHGSREQQAIAAENVYTLFCSPEDSFTPVPFTVSSTTDPNNSRFRSRTMILSTAFLAGLPPGVPLLHTNPDIGQLLANVSRLAAAEDSLAMVPDADANKSYSHLLTKLALVRHVALLASTKFLPPSDTQIAADLFFSLIPHAPGDVAGTVPASRLRTIFWLAKELLIRYNDAVGSVDGGPEAQGLAETEADNDAGIILAALLALLSSPDEPTSSTAARGFAILLNPDPVLASSNSNTGSGKEAGDGKDGDGHDHSRLAKRVLDAIVPRVAQRVRELNAAAAAAGGGDVADAVNSISTNASVVLPSRTNKANTGAAAAASQQPSDAHQSTTSNSPTRHIAEAYLTALTGILATTATPTTPTNNITSPAQLLRRHGHLPLVLPLLLQALDLPADGSLSTQPSTLTSTATSAVGEASVCMARRERRERVKAAALETLAAVIVAPPENLNMKEDGIGTDAGDGSSSGLGAIHAAGYTENLVSRLLDAATATATATAITTTARPQRANSPRVRLFALACLHLLARPEAAININGFNTDFGTIASGTIMPDDSRLRQTTLLPLKGAVVRRLLVALDDPKREVRKAAVDARGAWLRGVDDIAADED